MTLTTEQFNDVAALMRIPLSSASRTAAYAHFVAGATVSDAARMAGADYVAAWKLVKRINQELVRMRRIVSS